MNTWTPVWSKLPDSSVWAESKDVKILFITMLALKDRDHVVRYNAFELARKANLSESEVLAALEVLKSPDTRRLEPQDFGGRRIERVEDGWLLLNGEKYRRKMQDIYRKEYKRIKQAEYRDEPASEKASEAPDKYHKDSRTVLHLLNESSGRRFRETDENLGFISARLIEPGVDLAGVRLMISRQCQIWSGTTMAEYLKPETLFNKTKFDGYYAGRELPIETKTTNAKPLGPKITTQADAVNRTMREIEQATQRAMRL